jgi:sensor histidine kinase YesM
MAWQLLQFSWDSRDYIRLEYSPELWVDYVMSIILVYMNLCILVPKFFYPKKYFLYGLTLLICLLCGGIYSRFMAWYYILPWERIHVPGMAHHGPTYFFIPIRIIRNALRYTPIVSLTFFLKLIQDAYAKERRMRALEEEKHQAELDLLKAQIHPHFFFNTLNSLYALTMAKSGKGPEVVLQLSELMHYVLYEANASQVPLDTEIAHLRNYIEIEQLRFGDRLDLQFDVPADLSGRMIAPLLLLPFIENAFKHSLSHETQKAWIHIDIRLQQQDLCMKVANTWHPLEHKDKLPGIGLKNVRKRLELSYPELHQLDIRPGENLFEVYLKLSLHAKDPMRNSR